MRKHPSIRTNIQDGFPWLCFWCCFTEPTCRRHPATPLTVRSVTEVPTFTASCTSGLHSGVGVNSMYVQLAYYGVHYHRTTGARGLTATVMDGWGQVRTSDVIQRRACGDRDCRRHGGMSLRQDERCGTRAIRQIS